MKLNLGTALTVGTSGSRPGAPLQRPTFSTCALCRQENYYRTLGLSQVRHPLIAARVPSSTFTLTIWSANHNPPSKILYVQGATAQQIKSNFYELSRAHHPDKNLVSSSSTGERFKKISEAYSVLSNPVRRKEYDQTLLSTRGWEVGAGRSSHGAAGTTYAGMAGDYSAGRNAARRASANYAWSARGAKMGPRGGDTRGGRRDPLSSAHNHPADFSATLDRFQRLADRRKHPVDSPASPLPNHRTHHHPSDHPHPHPPKISPATQAAQMALMLSFIFWIGSKLQL
ncbi:hypothetical protein PCANC_01389 [Puccinia coronata f. sp. avenae]|uniref:J domain-containing protein n=1 Tax=Puccinia coronata f. sp. avenae TaxID=200324 RepID=A0A2N5W6B7_9BASI|nr:hypothetical protein PCANC_01389 [Puccinia coronata f. sp. avenae]